jgi:hypothetical protein
MESIFFYWIKLKMEWVHLEGIQRVEVSYRVWRQCCRDLRSARKDPVLRKHKRFLKEEVQMEYDELVDSILSLTVKEHSQLLQSVKHDRLYQLLVLYSMKT